MNDPSSQPLPMDVTVQDVKRMQDESQEFVLLDCREQDEHQLVRIDGSKLLPMSEIQQRIGELEPLRDQPVVVHCHHGGRSLQVATWLRQQGFERVQNMQGGIDQWSREIDSSLPRY